MRFLLDENVDPRLADHLKTLGHDVTTIILDYSRSIEDTQVLSIAQREQRILITNDRDFGELIISKGLPHAGVIYFRLRSTTLVLKLVRLDDVLGHYAHQLHQFLVVTELSIRVRPAHQR